MHVLCIICQNAELKAEALKHHIGAGHSLETILEKARENDLAAELAFKGALEELVGDEDKRVVGFLNRPKQTRTLAKQNRLRL